MKNLITPAIIADPIKAPQLRGFHRLVKIIVQIVPTILTPDFVLWIESVWADTVDEILSINLISELISSILSFTSLLNLFRLVFICSFK